MNTRQFRIADRMAQERLAERLAELKAEGYSYEHITRVLFADYGIEISRQTAARWGRELGLDDDPPGTAA